MEFSSQVSRLVSTTHICLTVYRNRQDQDLSESERDLWHNNSIGYSLVVSMWSCVCVWQNVDILDWFPLTLVSVTSSLMFHHHDCEAWFLIWLLAAQFSYPSYSTCVACTLVSGFEARGSTSDLDIKANTQRFTEHLHRWIVFGLCIANEHMLLSSTDR